MGRLPAPSVRLPVGTWCQPHLSGSRAPKLGAIHCTLIYCPPQGLAWFPGEEAKVVRTSALLALSHGGQGKEMTHMSMQ